jgi:hypothetical protein
VNFLLIDEGSEKFHTKRDAIGALGFAPSRNRGSTCSKNVVEQNKSKINVNGYSVLNKKSLKGPKIFIFL